MFIDNSTPYQPPCGDFFGRQSYQDAGPLLLVLTGGLANPA
jgi:hypothetical protein